MNRFPFAVAVLLLCTIPVFSDPAAAASNAVAIDTIWVLPAAMLVFFMQAGFPMVDTGFTRAKNAVNENFVRRTIDSIIRGARSGEIGDGKIFILDLGECIRIRSGETECGNRLASALCLILFGVL